MSWLSSAWRKLKKWQPGKTLKKAAPLIGSLLPIPGGPMVGAAIANILAKNISDPTKMQLGDVLRQGVGGAAVGATAGLLTGGQPGMAGIREAGSRVKNVGSAIKNLIGGGGGGVPAVPGSPGISPMSTMKADIPKMSPYELVKSSRTAQAMQRTPSVFQPGPVNLMTPNYAGGGASSAVGSVTSRGAKNVLRRTWDALTPDQKIALSMQGIGTGANVYGAYQAGKMDDKLLAISEEERKRQLAEHQAMNPIREALLSYILGEGGVGL